MSPSRDHIPFIFSQECTLRDCLCSCLYIKQNARLSSESASCSDTQSPQSAGLSDIICLAKTEMSPDLTNNSINIRVLNDNVPKKLSSGVKM